MNNLGVLGIVHSYIPMHVLKTHAIDAAAGLFWGFSLQKDSQT